MALADDLKSARASFASELASLAASPKPSYSVGGQSVSWPEYYKTLLQLVRDLGDAIQEAEPFDVVSRARPT